jgi:hypothetical protein
MSTQLVHLAQEQTFVSHRGKNEQCDARRELNGSWSQAKICRAIPWAATRTTKIGSRVDLQTETRAGPCEGFRDAEASLPYATRFFGDEPRDELILHPCSRARSSHSCCDHGEPRQHHDRQ